MQHSCMTQLLCAFALLAAACTSTPPATSSTSTTSTNTPQPPPEPAPPTNPHQAPQPTAGGGGGSGTGGTTADHPAGPTPPSQSSGPTPGEKCGANDTCRAGLECVSYYGIAGARGPQFKTCERRCSDKMPCSAGQQCNTIADGPGQVCR